LFINNDNNRLDLIRVIIKSDNNRLMIKNNKNGNISINDSLIESRDNKIMEITECRLSINNLRMVVSNSSSHQSMIDIK